MKKDALISDCGKFRYWLLRQWNEAKPLLLFIGLNPSTADAENDDATIRRLIYFATDMGYGGFYIVNLYPYRTAYPEELLSVSNPFGDNGTNEHWIRQLAIDAGKVVFCWGDSGCYVKLFKASTLLLTNAFPNAWCFGHNKSGSPKHPLYLAKNTPLIPFKKLS